MVVLYLIEYVFLEEREDFSRKHFLYKIISRHLKDHVWGGGDLSFTSLFSKFSHLRKWTLET